MRRRRIYSQKVYRNPYFRKKKTIRRISLKIKIIIVASLILAGGIFWILFFHSFFNIDSIKIKEGQGIEDSKFEFLIRGQLTEKRLFFLNQNNIFAFSKKEAKRRILKKYYVDDLEIKKKFPGEIIVNFSEKTPIAVWSENERYYYIDDEGNILYEIEALEVDTKDFNVLKNKEKESKIETSGFIRKITIGKGYLDFSLGLAKKIKKSELILPYNIFIINEAENTVEINLVQGPVVYFNVKENMENQFEKLEILLREKIKGELLNKTKYIDLRFGDKIYYK